MSSSKVSPFTMSLMDLRSASPCIIVGVGVGGAATGLSTPVVLSTL